MAQQDDFRHGLCDGVCGAEDCGTCMGAWFCTVCLYGRVDQRLDRYPDASSEGISNCSGGCWLLCAASYCHLGWVPLLLKRGEVRNKFGIQGNGCTDCLISYFCTPCMIGQMHAELKDRAINQQGYVAGPGYTKQQEGMVYQQPGYPAQGQPGYGPPQ